MIGAVPMRTRERVSGPSMRRLSMWAVGLLGLSMAGAIATIIAILVTGSTFDSPVVAAFGVVFAGSMFSSFLCMYYMNLALTAESAAGYTTSRIGYPHLELVDESTNLIVRSAREPLISREEYRHRVEAYQAVLRGSDNA